MILSVILHKKVEYSKKEIYSIIFYCKMYLTRKGETMGIKGKNDRMVVLACEECKRRNYTTVKNKKNSKERMELNKYCPFCQKHVLHKETK